jgi:hypothetical protein
MRVEKGMPESFRIQDYKYGIKEGRLKCTDAEIPPTAVGDFSSEA